MSGYTPDDVWSGEGNPVHGVAVRLPGEATQVGCVYCLAEDKINAPVTSGIIYYWQGTSMCSAHVEKYAGKK